MSSGTTEPIRLPLRFHVGDEVYTLVTQTEPFYDPSGEELLTRVDHDRKLFIMSDRCDGRYAVVAVFTMLLSAWEYRKNEVPLNFQQITGLASVMERFLVDLGLEEAVATSLATPREPKLTRRRWTPVRRGLLAAAMVAIIAGAWWSIISSVVPTHTDEASPQIVEVAAPLPEVVRPDRLSTVLFPEVAGTTVAHPTDPAFVFGTRDRQIIRADHDNGLSVLAETLFPVTAIHISPNGQYLAAYDRQDNIYLMEWNRPSEIRSWPAGRSIGWLTVDNQGNASWAGVGTSAVAVDAKTQATTKLLGVEQQINASSGTQASALIRSSHDRRTLVFEADGRTIPVNAQLMPSQGLADFDTSENRRTLVALIGDGLVLVAREQRDGQYQLQEHQLPASFGVGQVRVSRNGNTALIVTDQLYLIDLHRLQVMARSPLLPDAGPVFDMVWRENLNEIVLAHAKQGAVWRP